MTEPGLDGAFLEFIRDPDPGADRRIHEFYVPMFEGLGRVVDLGCGEGAFVALLAEAGHDAMGVDADPACAAASRQRGVQVDQADVGVWLIRQADATVDGLFCAHLVEHMHWPDVLSLFRQSHRVLRPGGRLVVVTPNARALYSHLEMFHLHFGHVAFYHPHLLAFFARQAGFEAVQEGENPSLAAPLFGPRPGDLRSRPVATPAAPVPPIAAPIPDAAAQQIAMPNPAAPVQPIALPRYEPDLPRRGGLLGGLWWRAKMWLVRLLVRPYLDPLVADLHATLAALDAERQRTAWLSDAVVAVAAQADGVRADLEGVVARLDRPFEAYIVADKARVAAGEQPGAAAP